jgi:hypothetical protein
MKKRPKGFNKMTLEQQEVVLIGEYQELTKRLDSVSRELGRVRGGYKIEASEETSERPDLLEMRPDLIKPKAGVV